MSTAPLLGRAELLALLNELAERLRRRGARVNLYVVGGAAMALAYDARRATRDIDAVVLDGHGPLTEEVRTMAREYGLPTTWLNDQATMYVSTQSDPERSVVFDHPSLTISAASVKHLLAMKLLAARASDIADLRWLLKAHGASSTSDAANVLAEVFPGQALSQRAALIVEDLLGPDAS